MPIKAFSQDLTIPEGLSFERAYISIANGQGTQHEFLAEVAMTPAQKYYGIMFRTYLAPDQGMLYLNDEPSVVSFWTKNTLVSIDMIFIDAMGCITEVHPNRPVNSTESIVSKGDVKAVFEVAAGTADKLGIDVGDQVFSGIFGEHAVRQCPEEQKVS